MSARVIRSGSAANHALHFGNATQRAFSGLFFDEMPI
jgi:hypothetical protein